VAIRHFGAGGVVVVVADVTSSPTLTLWVSESLVPVIDSVKAPVEAEEDALTVSVEVADEPEGGVTGPGKLTETPEGAVPIQEYANETAELNPFVEPTLMVDVPMAPWVILNELGLAVIVKSGVTVIVSVRL